MSTDTDKKPGGVSASALPSLMDSDPLFFADMTRGAVECTLAAEAAGEYDGSRFFLRRRADYEEAVRLLREGMSYRRIAKRMPPCSPNTIRAIARREGINPVDTRIAKTVDALTDFAVETAERLRDEGGSIPIAQVAVPFGIAVEKLQLLSGGATQRVEIVEPVKPLDFEDYIEALPAVEASPMGLGGETAAQKGPAVLGSIPAGDAGIDGQSLLSSEAEPVTVDRATPDATPDAARPERPPGGEGVSNLPPPAPEPIQSPKSGQPTKDPP